MTIEFSGQDRIEAVYEEAKELILLGLDIGVMYISDESCVSDFNPDEGNLAKLSALVGRPVGRHDYIVELAEEYSRGVQGMLVKRRVSKRVLGAVSRVLRNPENSKKAKMAAGSALTQRTTSRRGKPEGLCNLCGDVTNRTYYSYKAPQLVGSNHDYFVCPPCREDEQWAEDNHSGS